MILALSLLGLFSQDCAEGFRRSQEFQAARVVYGEENFFDSGCESPSVTSRSYGAYSLGGPVGEAREIDFVFEKVTFTPETEEVAASYRARALCGLTEWSVYRETDISGLDCDFLANGSSFRVPAAGDRRFGIVKGEGGSLQFGQLSPELDGTSPERRPVFLDPVPYWRRAQ